MMRLSLFFLISSLLVLFQTSKAVEFSMCKVGTNNECETLKNSDNVNNIKCVSVPNIYRCMKLVKEGKVDVLPVSDTDLYPAGKFLGLKPFLQEILKSNKTYLYKAVIAIKKDSAIKNLKTLINKKSCHTGAGKTTGWTVPVSNLQEKKIIKIKSCYNTIENVADFFSESCVPGAMEPKFNPFYTNRVAICGLCNDNCTRTDKYAGYDGAMKCLEEGKGDVAFVSNNEVGNNAWNLLCPDGQVKDDSDFENCNWATRPSVAFVASSQLGSKLTQIAKVLKDNSANVISSFSIFKGAKQFQDTDKDYKKYMGDGFFNTFEYYHNCKGDLRWCTVSSAEMEKCHDLKLAFAAKRATNKLMCVEGEDAHNCLNKVVNKEADFIVLDGGLIGDAIKQCDIEPKIAEKHLQTSLEAASYFAVAVVKKSSKWKFPNLKGAKTCHTGYGKTSGWKVPVGLLVSAGQILNGNLAVKVGNYFNKSCVPGALDTKNNPNNNNPASLCALCPNNGQKCSMNSNNVYYGYTGAFRCLVESDADIAFVKHTTVLESTDGVGKEPWEKNLKSGDYKLLCPDGTEDSVSNWSKCHLARVPSHAMIFRRDSTDAKRMFEVFSSMDLNSEETKQLLFSSPGDKNLLFKDSAIGLSFISDTHQYLTKEYKKILEVFGSKTNICFSSASTVYGTFTLLLITIITIFF